MQLTDLPSTSTPILLRRTLTNPPKDYAKYYVLSLILVHEILNVLNFIWTYMAVYNLSLLVVFAVLFQLQNVHMKTTYSFNDLSAGGSYVKMLIMSFFSIAGVPPFVGFFSKTFVFILLASSNFALGFPFFFSILFIGLYFYIQNIRFLNASNVSNFQPVFELYIRVAPSFLYLTFSICFFLVKSFKLFCQI